MAVGGMMGAIALRVASNRLLYNYPVALTAFRHYVDWNNSTDAYIANTDFNRLGTSSINLAHYGPRISKADQRFKKLNVTELNYGKWQCIQHASMHIAPSDLFSDSNIAKLDNEMDVARAGLIKEKVINEFHGNITAFASVVLHQIRNTDGRTQTAFCDLMSVMWYLVDEFQCRKYPNSVLNFVYDELLARRGVVVPKDNNRNSMLAMTDTTSSMMHLAVCEAISKEHNDVIIIPKGSFESAIMAPYAGKGSMRAAEVHKDGKLEVEKFSEMIQVLRSSGKAPKALFLTNPTNPFGKLYTEEEMIKIAEICIANNIKIISDEQFWGFELSGKDAKSIASLSVTVDGRVHKVLDHTVIIQGSSKICAEEGCKFSFAVSGDTQLISEIAKINERVGYHFGYGSLVGFNNLIKGAIKDTDEQRQVLSKQYDDLVNTVATINRSYGMEIFKVEGDRPENGFFAVLSVPSKILNMVGVNNGTELYNYLLWQANVRVRPLDSMFGETEADRVMFRINFAHTRSLTLLDEDSYPKPESMLDGLNRIANMVKLISTGQYNTHYRDIESHVRIIESITPLCIESEDIFFPIKNAPIPKVPSH